MPARHEGEGTDSNTAINGIENPIERVEHRRSSTVPAPSGGGKIIFDDFTGDKTMASLRSRLPGMRAKVQTATLLLMGLHELMGPQVE